MTSRSHRHGLLAPRRPRTIVNYAVHALDGSRQEYALDRDQRHRDANADDPYLSPAKSEAVRALLVLIEFAQAHTYSTVHTPDNELDLRGFCLDAKLTERQVEVALMIGEGWGIGAIAERLEITRQAVSMHLTRARVKLIRQALPVDALLPKRLQDAYDCSGQLTLCAGSSHA